MNNYMYSMRLDFLDANAFLLLEELLKKKYYLRELAEQSGLAPSTVHKTISKLFKKKMVVMEKQKNRKLFSLNYYSPLTTKAISMIFVNKIIECRAFGKLKKLQPIGIYLFGTAASGKITADSDIDLAVFFEKSQNSLKLSEIKRELSNELKKDVQLIVLTKQKIESMEKENIELLNQIKNKAIILWGENLESSK